MSVDLVTELRSLVGTLRRRRLYRSAEMVTDAAAELGRLRAIVERLPKTADGVPVVLGDNIYGVDHDGTVFGCGFISMTAPSENYGEWFGIGRDEGGSEWRSTPRMFYSTRAAAEAAMKGAPQ